MIVKIQTSTVLPNSPTFTYVDSNSEKTVAARVDGTSFGFILWQGDAYDAIGQWTQEQADAASMAYLTSIQQS